MPPTLAILRCGNCLTLNRVPLPKLAGKPACGNCKTVLEFPNGPLTARTDTFDRTVAYWPETVLVMFTAPACLYCKIIGPTVAELARRHAGRLKVMTADCETEEYLAKRFNVEKTPTFLMYQNGELVLRVDGAPKGKEELVKWIENLLGATPPEGGDA